jgi:phage tail sheath protein FI
MAIQVSYPGVYIDEFAPGAPIQGVGTGVAAFIGVASSGNPNEAMRITSWDSFLQDFGDQPIPGFYLWYAVRGFFDNGGQTCYVVRASNGTFSEGFLQDRNVVPDNLIRVRSRRLGPPPQPITIDIADASLLPAGTVLYTAAANCNALSPARRDLTLNAGQGALFRPQDSVLIAGTQTATIVRITGDVLRIDEPVNVAIGAPPFAVRLADIPQGARTVRIRPPVALAAGILVPGTMLEIFPQGTIPPYPAPHDAQIVDSVQVEQGPNPTYRVTFRQGLNASFPLAVAGAFDVASREFNFTVNEGGVPTAQFANLSIDQAHPRYYMDIINNANASVRVDPVQPVPPAPPPLNLPVAGIGFNLPIVGNPENLAGLADMNFQNALDALRQVTDVNLVAIPDRINDPIRQALIEHCERMGDRFGVLDPLPNSPPFDDGGLVASVETQRHGLDSTRGYAALYYPWISVPRATPGPPMEIPPSGHVCGIMAQTDASRGVHKAPANVIISGALDVEEGRALSDADQGILNLEGINIIRRFRIGARPVVWGARTTATDTNWQYVNIRRLFLFLEKSIQEGIRWAVFEPNNTGLWEKLRRTITDFLTRVWRDGALFGETADKAFYVRIDEVLNPDSERALGRLHIEIGVRPSYPAEFIIVRIGIWDGGAQVAEG